MNGEKTKKYFAIFMLVMFVVSSLAFAMMSTVDVGTTSKENVINRPLTNEEEAYFLQNNIIIIKYFYSENCDDCAAFQNQLTELLDFFKEDIVVEMIDSDVYANETTALGIDSIPTFYLKGNTIEKVTENTDTQKLITNICLLYFGYVPECNQ